MCKFTFKIRNTTALYEIFDDFGGSIAGLDSPLLCDNPVLWNSAVVVISCWALLFLVNRN